MESLAIALSEMQILVKNRYETPTKVLFESHHHGLRVVAYFSATIQPSLKFE